MKGSVKEKLLEHLATYRREHTTKGCKITHMFGIPMILVSFFFVSTNLLTAVLLFVVGLALQIIGHRVFEKNRPIFLSNPLDLLNYTAAIIFVADEWFKLLSGRGI